MLPLIFILPCMNRVLGFREPSNRPAASSSVSEKVASAVPSLPFLTLPLPFLRSTVQTVGLVSLFYCMSVPLLLQDFEVVDVAHLLDKLWALLLHQGSEVLKQFVHLHDVINLKIYIADLVGLIQPNQFSRTIKFPVTLPPLSSPFNPPPPP